MEAPAAKGAIKPSGRFAGLAVLLSALAGAFLFISLLGHHHVRVEAFQLRLGLQPSPAGYTVLEIPPLATIRAETHATPLRISVRLESIDPRTVQKTMEKSREPSGLINAATGELRTAAAFFTLKLMVLAAAGGAFGVFLWRRKPGILHLQGSLAAVLTVGALLAGTYATYDTGKFKNPELDGALKAAPWVIGMAGDAFSKINTLSDKLTAMADNLHQLLNQIDRLKPFGEDREGMVKVLHISDIHNNPAALDYVRRVAGLFNVDLIIDTGDISDFGTPLEGLLPERLAGLGIPYLFIAGNHDSPETIKKMKTISGVIVLDGTTVTAKNLRVLGVADPSSKTGSIEPPSPDTITRHASHVEELLKSQPEKPDILALHNHRTAWRLAGKAPVILHGHNHKLSVGEVSGSIIISPGSTGAAGLRRLQGDRTPYTLVIQYYAPDDGKMNLLAADTITINNLDSGLRLERHVFSSKNRE